MKNPLSTALLFAACFWGQPARVNGDNDAPPPSETPPPTPAPLDLGPVDGDTPPDFSALDAKYGEGGDEPPKPPEPPKTDPPPPKPPEPPKPGEKPPTDPAVPAVVDPAQPPKPPEKTEPPKDAKKDFDPDAAEKAVKEAEIAPNVSPKSREGFDAVKNAAQAAIKDNKTLRKELESLRGTVGKLPAEVEAELQQLREFKTVYGAESDPAFQKKWQDKLVAADEGLLKMLVDDPALRLPQADADALKAAGLDTPKGQKMVNDILKTLHGGDDILLYNRVLKAVQDRYGVHDQKAAEIAALRAKQGDFGKLKTETEQAERQKFYGGLNGRMVELFKDAEWGKYKHASLGPDGKLVYNAEFAKLPAEEQAKITAFNTRLAEKVVPAMQADIAAAQARDPGKIAELVFKAHSLDVAQEENERLTTELEAAQTRIKELEKTAEGVARISSPGRVDNAPPKGSEKPSTNYEQTADEAADEFARQKGIKG